VFPELRNRCRQRGADFVAIDLRWGVTEDEAKSEGALRICLDEIERCRPFFLCLLGDRYGWVPPPEEVPRNFFEHVRAGQDVAPADAERLARFYRLENHDAAAVPPAARPARAPCRRR
jgi:hypothetical protein